MRVIRMCSMNTFFFTNMATILNLLDLSSIMGCPGGHSLSIYTRFSDLFSDYYFFLGKLKEKHL